MKIRNSIKLKITRNAELLQKSRYERSYFRVVFLYFTMVSIILVAIKSRGRIRKELVYGNYIDIRLVVLIIKFKSEKLYF